VDTHTGECQFTTVVTRPSALGRLFARRRGARLVMEIGPMAGWIGDLARASGLRRVQVAHVGHEAWRWRNVRRKTDHSDAIRLAEMAMAGRLPEASWVALRYNPRLRAIHERIHRGSRTRRKVAIVAVARRLAVIAWAMLRDGMRCQPDRVAATAAAAWMEE